MMQNMNLKKFLFIWVFCALIAPTVDAQLLRHSVKLNEVEVGEGWAKNSINAVIFRKNSLVTHKDTQYIAYYNGDGYMVVGKRKIGTAEWELKTTSHKGNTADAHNSISIMVDGDGFLHVSWDHHNNPLRYAKSTEPGSLELCQTIPMTGIAEKSVSYPEFFKMADGNLLFFYRDGGSGRGNLVINKYDTKTKTWTQLHDNLISGEGQRNAYWQAVIDRQGVIHVSWVWRENPNVASNHDLCYARSKDGGVTWERTNGKKYALPITASTAEYAYKIAERSDLINQTSMDVSDCGLPFIATYWRSADSPSPQYRVVFFDGKDWKMQNLALRATPFSLSGAGTKKIPISRPQILVSGKADRIAAYLIFRDEERENKISVAIAPNIWRVKWNVIDLTTEGYGSWEPTYDTELWRNEGILNLFAQYVEQVDGEGQAELGAQKVKVIEWVPNERRR
jgi:hypothetical protein